MAASDHDAVRQLSLELEDAEDEIGRCKLLATVKTVKSRLERVDSQSAPEVLLRPAELEGRIEFHNVNFSYPADSRKQILFDVSFFTNPPSQLLQPLCGQDGKELPKIRSIGFVGQTGKSCRMNCLC